MISRESVAWFLVAILVFLWWGERNDRNGYHNDFRFAASEVIRLSAELRIQNKAWVQQHKDYLDALKMDEGADTLTDHVQPSRGTHDRN